MPGRPGGCFPRFSRRQLLCFKAWWVRSRMLGCGLSCLCRYNASLVFQSVKPFRLACFPARIAVSRLHQSRSCDPKQIKSWATSAYNVGFAVLGYLGFIRFPPRLRGTAVQRSILWLYGTSRDHLALQHNSSADTVQGAEITHIIFLTGFWSKWAQHLRLCAL